MEQIQINKLNEVSPVAMHINFIHLANRFRVNSDVNLCNYWTFPALK